MVSQRARRHQKVHCTNYLSRVCCTNFRKLVLVIELTFIERVKVKMDRNMLAMLITKHYVDLNLDL